MLWNVGVIEGELPKEIYSDPPIRRMHHATGPATQLKSQMTGALALRIFVLLQLMKRLKWGPSPEQDNTGCCLAVSEGQRELREEGKEEGSRTKSRN